MELIEHQDGHRRLLSHDVAVRAPHVAAHRPHPLYPLWPPLVEEPLQRRRLSALAAPQQPLAPQVVDLCVVDVTFPTADLVDTDVEHVVHISMLDTVLDC